MPKRAKEWTALECKKTTKPGSYAVGAISGLQLVVKPSQAKSWVLRTMVGIKRRHIGLGPYPEVSLAEAREKARRMKKEIKAGVDPVETRRAARFELIRSQNGRMTFREAARLCHEKVASESRNKKHQRQWLSSLEQHAFPKIGHMAVDDIDLPHVLAVLEPIWTTRTVTATRVRARMETVLNWSIVSGYRKGDNAARWKGHLDTILPQPKKIRKVRHHRALPWRDIGAFMRDLRSRDGMAARALEFLILTAARSGEVRMATWDEVDFAARTWTVPGSRMKAGKEHAVPLPDAAVRLLEDLPRFEGSPYVFTAARGGPLSDMAISAVCRRMGVDAVPHGFRSTFRDWAAESTNFPREVCEQALAHTLPSAVEAAYRRGDLFQKRQKLMEAWSAYANKVQDQTPATVTPIRNREAK